MEVSAVIPTRNRSSYVKTLLEDLTMQTYPINEIIIVDASDDKSYKDELFKRFQRLPLVWLDSEASVCVQRNKGIRFAKSPWIFLCDDDIKIPVDYIEQLIHFIKANRDCGSASGLFMQSEADEWVFSYPYKNFRALVWAYIFKLSVWGQVDVMKVNFFLRPFYRFICNYYKKLGNTMTSAGWPVITQLESPHFKTQTYSLGSSITKRTWLIESPYDEVLDPSGIGDNYGVTLGFPNGQGMHVIHRTFSHNYRAKDNRLEASTAYFRRILALHYYLVTRKGFTSTNRRWFVWSLFGNVLLSLGKLKFHLVKANVKAIALIVMNKNPYVLGKCDGRKIIKPTC
jgi:glycosyltransferase involved in cell wall biosynthesis